MNEIRISIQKKNLRKYNFLPLLYNKFQLELLMKNSNTHIVSLFKDHLFYDDTTEFFKQYYKKKDIYKNLKSLYDYYVSSSYLFPNYTVLNEGKYIYRNIIRKQRLIDYLEDLEDKKIAEQKKKEMKKKSDPDDSQNYSKLFNTQIFNNIIQETGNNSKINELFCIPTKKNDEKTDSFSSLIKLTNKIEEKVNNAKKNSKEYFPIYIQNIKYRSKEKYIMDISQKINSHKDIHKKDKASYTKINNFFGTLNSKIIFKSNKPTNIGLVKRNELLRSNLSNISTNTKSNNYKKNNIIINIFNSTKNDNLGLTSNSNVLTTNNSNRVLKCINSDKKQFETYSNENKRVLKPIKTLRNINSKYNYKMRQPTYLKNLKYPNLSSKNIKSKMILFGLNHENKLFEKKTIENKSLPKSYNRQKKKLHKTILNDQSQKSITSKNNIIYSRINKGPKTLIYNKTLLNEIALIIQKIDRRKFISLNSNSIFGQKFSKKKSPKQSIKRNLRNVKNLGPLIDYNTQRITRNTSKEKLTKQNTILRMNLKDSMTYRGSKEKLFSNVKKASKNRTLISNYSKDSGMDSKTKYFLNKNQKNIAINKKNTNTNTIVRKKMIKKMNVKKYLKTENI